MITSVRQKRDVLDRLRANRALIRQSGVHRLGLFGSFAHGQAKADSDVDLLVEFEPGAKSFDTFMALAELLDTLLARRVELVTRESLSPHLGSKILAEVEDVPLDP